MPPSGSPHTRLFAAHPASAYFVLRHGESAANRAGLIVSAPESGVSAYGLTPRGRRQVAEGIERARREGVWTTIDRVVTSPFLRTLESAKVAAAMLGAEVKEDRRLAERYFGELERAPSEAYEAVWARDRQDAAHTDRGVESVTSVFRRVQELIDQMEATGAPQRLLFCTHGDVASVLICAFAGEDLRRHREVGSLANGEVRRLASRSRA